jgi:hypothetical protein
MSRSTLDALIRTQVASALKEAQPGVLKIRAPIARF